MFQIAFEDNSRYTCRGGTGQGDSDSPAVQHHERVTQAAGITDDGAQKEKQEREDE